MKTKNVIATWALFAGVFTAAQALADVRLPSIFSDHMVLQRATAVPVWGWADPREKITLTIADQTKTTTADADGKWSVKLDKIATSEPVIMTVQGKNTVTVQDVLIGEVWLASGQSNMQLPVNDVNDGWREKAEAKFPQIRMFSVAKHPAITPQTTCDGEWVVCSPETAGRFSAAAYFFGRELHQKLNTPVGLINASWGGTPIEAWISLPRQEGKPEFAPVFKPWENKMRVPYDEKKAMAQYEKQLAAWKISSEQRKAEGKPAGYPPGPPVTPREDKNYPANLFNGMIAPLIPYAIRGTIWYQGENNAQSAYAELYATQLPLLIQDWRKQWAQGDFPFAWVQLPNFQPKPGVSAELSQWAVVRDGMLKNLSIPNTGMAITIDIGDPDHIHPKNKQDVGHRLALWALAKVYSQNIPFSGPLPAGQKVNGKEITLSFMHTDGGLMAKGGELKGFTIAGADRKWAPAQARISGDQVIVSSPEVNAPVSVRYAWADNPDCNLYNGADLPASPFRTDDW